MDADREYRIRAVKGGLVCVMVVGGCNHDFALYSMLSKLSEIVIIYP